MTKKPWRSFTAKHSGFCEIQIGNQTTATSYEIGIVETGRQMVFAGVEVRVLNPAGGCWIGHDDWSFPEALRAAEALAEVEGVKLICAALSMFWFETGLSSGSGWGYFPWSQGPVHMMDKPTSPENDDQATPEHGTSKARSSVFRRCR